ncbi:MAG: hypothetical protein HYV13_03315 [Candidatus Doudnabacteria bacterium]|nr:hypothetical protein [Candidatus Doudnabacteria bacterium]
MTASSVKLSLILASGLLGCLLIFIFLLNPSLNQLTALSGNLTQKKLELATVEHQVVAYQNAQADLSKAAQKERIFNAFLVREDLVAAVKHLEAAAAATKTQESLKIDEPDQDPKNKPQPVVDVKGLEEIPYRVLTLNDYIGTIQFLRYLEHLPEFTEVSKITLSAETVDSEVSKTKIYTGKVFGSIDGVFFVKQPSP